MKTPIGSDNPDEGKDKDQKNQNKANEDASKKLSEEAYKDDKTYRGANKAEDQRKQESTKQHQTNLTLTDDKAQDRAAMKERMNEKSNQGQAKEKGNDKA
jgi:hypothetical protein